MLHKHNADRRHHIPKMAFKVRNCPAYEAGLRRRGSLTSWIEDAALEYWQTFGPGGQARYADVAIRTQRTEAAVGVAVLNPMLAAGRPDCVRRQPVIA